MGMSCAACATRVGKTLNAQPGVREATVNYAAATATVEYDPDGCSPESLRQALREAGYDLLRSDMEGAVSRATQELDKLHQMVEQLSSHFDSQDEHLHKLTQDCMSEFAPPAPEPLPLNEK